MKRMLFLLVLCAAVARGQEEPAPFWMPPPPAKTKKKKPVQVEPLEIKKKKPPPRAEKKKPAPPPPAPKEEVRTPEPTWIVPPPRPAPPPPVRPVEPAPAPPAAAARVPAPVIAPPPPVIVPPPPSPRLEPQPEPEAETELERPPSPRWTADAIAGLWGKSRSDGSGRLWDLAYGLRIGYAILSDRLELELLAARAGSSAGSPFVNASAAHNLFALRAFWVFGPPRISLLLGAGAGATWAQTHYSLTDVGGTPTGLEANSVKPVMQITTAARARLIRGLEARVEVSAVLRGGALEPLPLVGFGAAF